MGECGCGKTELVRSLLHLQDCNTSSSWSNTEALTQVRYLCAWLGVELVTLNVHGGTTESDIDRVP